MSSPQARLGPHPTGSGVGPVRVDAALRQTVALLELVRQEEALLGWLDDCVAQLQAVHRARQTLLDFTDVELAEARQVKNCREASSNADASGPSGSDPFHSGLSDAGSRGSSPTPVGAGS